MTDERMPPTWAVRTKADRLALEQGYYWDEGEADRITQFAETYIRPQFIRGRFSLLPWQVRFLKSLYGWRHPSGRRRWKRATLHVSKKQGKTLLVSIICAYEMFASDTPSPIVASASTTTSNAKQVFAELAHTIRHQPALKKASRLVESQKQIKVKSRNATYFALSADASNAEGLNLVCICCDEVHSWQASKGERLYRAIEYSTIARPDGLLITISTAGHDVSHFYHAIYMRSKNIIAGVDEDLQTYAEVYELPEGADPEDETLWESANPSIGTSFTADDFRRDLQTAKANRGDWLSFRRYRLNEWVQAEDSWLDLGKWDACLRPMSEAELSSRPCWLGVDLSQTVDPTSVSCCWSLGDRKFFVRSWAFICRAGVKKREAQNLTKYDEWPEVVSTAGDVIDEGRVEAFITYLLNTYDVKEVIFDAYNAISLATRLGEHVTTFKFPQNYKYYNHPCKMFETAIAERRMAHDGGKYLRWNIQNVRLDTDTYGNVKPSRDKSTDKIDGAISAIMCYARAMEAEATPARKSRYDDAGLFRI